MQRSRAAGQCDGMLHSYLSRELGLEGIDVRSERRDPVGIKRIHEQRTFVTVDVGWREKDPTPVVGFSHGCCHMPVRNESFSDEGAA